MARLQDFQSVTPSSSDNLLIVQPTGQGLAPFGSTIGNKAPKTDLASISITGTTNNTGSTIKAGTFFYLNGYLVRAKQDIQNTATFTSTNYATVTAGSLNEIEPIISGTLTAQSDWNVTTNFCYKSGHVVSFCFDSDKSTALNSGWNDIALLPTGFIPYENVFLACNDPARSDGGTAEVQITKYGFVRVYKNTQQSQRVRVSATYLVP